MRPLNSLSRVTWCFSCLRRPTASYMLVFSDSFLPESDPAPLATTEYSGATSWGVRLYAYSNISAEQIEGMRVASSKGRFVWEQFIDPGATYEYIGNVEVDETQRSACLYV